MEARVSEAVLSHKHPNTGLQVHTRSEGQDVREWGKGLNETPTEHPITAKIKKGKFWKLPTQTTR